MPKIKRRYYQQAKKITDSTIDIVQSIHQSSALSRNSSSLSNNNISLSFERDDSVEINVDSGSTSEQVNNESSDFEENESINHSGSNNCDDGVINYCY